MIPKLTLLLLSFSLILPSKNNGGLHSHLEEKAKTVHRHEDCDEIKFDKEAFNDVKNDLAELSMDDEKTRIVPNARVIMEDIGGGGGGSYSPTTYSFNWKTFFENATTYQPVNKLGTCGYVSLIELLSFYDTFYNDSVIPEQYDRNTKGSISFSDAVSTSPGVEPIKRSQYPCDKKPNYDATQYRGFCYDRKDFCFQSYLTVLNNKNEGTDNDTDFQYGIGSWNYQAMLDNVYGSGKVTVTDYGVDDTNFRQNLAKMAIKKVISMGGPVIVHIKDETDPNKDNWKYHSVVAYDYDDNYIYANYGWGSGSTHQPLIGGVGDYDYKLIYRVAVLDFPMGRKHSNNYEINGKDFCAYCGYEVDYLNSTKYMLAANVTSSVKKVTWGYNFLDGNAPYFDLHILNAKGNEIKVYENICYHEKIFSEADWDEILACSGGKMGFYVVAHDSSNESIEGSSTYYVSLSNIQNNHFYSSSYTFSERSRVIEFVSTFDVTQPVKVYKIYFAHGGRKLIQTFSNSILALVSFKMINATTGEIITSNSTGFHTNAFMHQFFEPGNYYLQFANFSTVKFVITQTTNDYYSAIGNTNKVQWQSYSTIKPLRMDLARYHNFEMRHYQNIVATFTPTTTRSYSFTLSSSFDSYLYVLDPRKTSSMTYGQEYDDDSAGNLNAKLVTTLNANITYLVIVAQYNPSDAFPNGNSMNTVTIDLQ